jgi:hypothetical protein
MYYNYRSGNSTLNMAYLITLIIFYVIEVIAYWKMFEKAGVKGWLSLIPIVR